MKIKRTINRGLAEKFNFTSKPPHAKSFTPSGIQYYLNDSWDKYMQAIGEKSSSNYSKELELDLSNIYQLTINSIGKFVETYCLGGNINWIKLMEEYDGLEIVDVDAIKKTSLGTAYFEYWFYDCGYIWRSDCVKAIR